MTANKLFSSVLTFLFVFVCGCVTTGSNTKSSSASPQSSSKGEIIFIDDFNGTALDKNKWALTVEVVGDIKVKDGNCIFDDTNNDGSEWTEMYSKELEFPKKYEIEYRTKVTPGHAMGFTFFQKTDPQACCKIWAKLKSSPPEIELYSNNIVIETIKIPKSPATDYVTVTLQVDEDKVNVKGGKVVEPLPFPPMKSLNIYGWRGFSGITYVDYIKVTKVD